MPEIILSDRFDFVAIVDEEDYQYLVRWRWTFKRSTRKHNGSIYACRNTWAGSMKDGTRRQVKIMLHDVVLERHLGPRPGPEYSAHHINAESLDNRRKNLEWATRSKQNAEAWKKRRKNGGTGT